MSKRIGYGFLAFMFASWMIVSVIIVFQSILTDISSALVGLVFALVCGFLTYRCTRKAFGLKKRIPPESRKYIPGTPLPVVTANDLILSPSEVCHIFEHVKVGKFRTVTTKSGKQAILNTDTGKFYVTNKRIIAASPRYSFDQSLESLSTYTQYTDGFSLQFGKTTYVIIVRDPIYVLTVLKSALAAKKAKN